MSIIHDYAAIRARRDELGGEPPAWAGEWMSKAIAVINSVAEWHAIGAASEWPKPGHQLGCAVNGNRLGTRSCDCGAAVSKDDDR